MHTTPESDITQKITGDELRKKLETEAAKHKEAEEVPQVDTAKKLGGVLAKALEDGKKAMQDPHGIGAAVGNTLNNIIDGSKDTVKGTKSFFSELKKGYLDARNRK